MHSYHTVSAAILWFGQCLERAFFLPVQTEPLIVMDVDHGVLSVLTWRRKYVKLNMQNMMPPAAEKFGKNRPFVQGQLTS